MDESDQIEVHYLSQIGIDIRNTKMAEVPPGTIDQNDPEVIVRKKKRGVFEKPHYSKK